MKPSCVAREAPRRRGALYLDTNRGLLRVTQARPWGRNIGLELEDGRFVVVDPRRELVTNKGRAS